MTTTSEFYLEEQGKLVTHHVVPDRDSLLLTLLAGQVVDGAEVIVMPFLGSAQQVRTAACYARARLQRAKIYGYPERLENETLNTSAALEAIGRGGAVVRITLEQPPEDGVPDIEAFFGQMEKVRQTIWQGPDEGDIS